MIRAETEDCQVALDPAFMIQHQRVAGAADRAVNAVGTDGLKAVQRVRSGNVNLAEARQLGEPRRLMRGSHFGPHLVKPVGTAKGQHRLACLAEIEWALESEHLAEMRTLRHPFIMQRQGAKVPCGGPLPAWIRDFIVPSQRFGRAGRQRSSTVNRGIEPLRIGLVKVGRRGAMLDGMGQRHAGTAAGGDAHRIHSAPKEQAARLSRFTKQETAVGSEALRSVQKHLHFRRLQTGQTVERVMHHRLEMIPVLGKQLESEIMTNPFRIDRFAHRLETADEQAAGVIADVEMTVMIRQCRQIAADAVHRLGQKIEMLARPGRHFGPGHGGGLAAPQPRAQRDGVTSDGAAISLDTDHPATFGQDTGHACVLENTGAAGTRTLDQRGAKIGRTDPAVIRRPDSADDIIRIHQRPAFGRLAGRNGIGLHSEQSGKSRLPAHMHHPVLVRGNRQRALVDPADLLAGFFFKARIKGYGIAHQIRQVTGRAERAHLCRRMPGCAGCQFVALEQDRVGHAIPGQMIERGTSHDPAADHNDRGVSWKIFTRRLHKDTPCRRLFRAPAALLRRLYCPTEIVTFETNLQVCYIYFIRV